MNKRIAEILVECGWATDLQAITDGTDITDYEVWYTQEGNYCGNWERVEPFYSGNDSSRECIARRQLDALEDWLVVQQTDLWIESANEYDCRFDISNHQWRLDRIKWCLQEIEK